MHDFLAIAKALADEKRLRALCALGDRELCVCQITELLNLAPSTVSKHMAILRQARLVEGRKRGRWMYYRLAGYEAPAGVKEAIAWVRRNLMNTREITVDARRLEGILRMDPEELCRRQSQR